MYHLWYKDSSAWINKLYKNLTIMIMITFTLDIMFSTCLIIDKFCDIDRYCHESDKKIPLQVSKNICYFIANILFYILLLLRITIPFELNKSVVYSLSFIIVLSGITAIVYIIHNFMLYENYATWRIISGILLADSLLFSAFVLGIFISKMKKLMINIDPSTSLKAERNVTLMTNLVAKHGLLFGIAIIINPAHLVSVILNSYFGGWDNFVADMTMNVTQVTEAFVMIFVLWLLLRVNYSRYIKLCKYCHIGVARCCFNNIDTMKLVDDTYQELNSVMIEISNEQSTATVSG